jgi:hypothetical protein
MKIISDEIAEWKRKSRKGKLEKKKVYMQEDAITF